MTGDGLAEPAPAPAGRTIPGWAPVLLVVVAVAGFLVTRLLFLDADIPEWDLTRYSPIDEFAYAGPAFNLLQYGTWVHSAAPWSGVEGSPMNVSQNLVAAATMALGGNTYFGLRLSSVLFGLIGFLCLVGVVKRLADDARDRDAVPEWLAFGVTAAAAILLLLDFSSLLSGRIVEPTVTRFAAVAAVLFLVARGSFLGNHHGIGRSVAFGALVAASVLFVYIYNAFLVPAAFLALVWWAVRDGGARSAVRHGAAFAGGCLIVTIVYFGLVWVTYGQSPLDWSRVWIGSISTTARGVGLSIEKVLSILDANVFRLDPAFLALFLVSLPVFVWQLIRRPTAIGVLVATGLAALVVQSAAVADYPERKFLMLLLFAVPVAATAILAASGYRAWAVADRRHLVAAVGCLVAGLAVAAVAIPIGRVPPHGTTLARIVLIAGIVGVGALLILAIVRRPRPRAIACVALCLAILAPLADVDGAFVFRRPTFTYRDAQIAAGRTVDGQVTAGGLSFGMALYNTSRPVLSGYVFGKTPQEYEHDVVRMFSEGLATSLFSYVDPKTRSHLEALGFRLAETYDVILPLGRKLGRYVYGATSGLETAASR